MLLYVAEAWNALVFGRRTTSRVLEKIKKVKSGAVHFPGTEK